MQRKAAHGCGPLEAEQFVAQRGAAIIGAIAV
jgi:hypothetical protein